jgi:excisionase family DNA binding protein
MELKLEELYSTAEAAKILGVKPGSVRKYCRAETLKAKKVGRDYVITGQAIADYREKHLGKIGQKLDHKDK